MKDYTVRLTVSCSEEDRWDRLRAVHVCPPDVTLTYRVRASTVHHAKLSALRAFIKDKRDMNVQSVRFADVKESVRPTPVKRGR
jgi:hypothetical protein